MPQAVCLTVSSWITHCLSASNQQDNLIFLLPTTPWCMHCFYFWKESCKTHCIHSFALTIHNMLVMWHGTILPENIKRLLLLFKNAPDILPVKHDFCNNTFFTFLLKDLEYVTLYTTTGTMLIISLSNMHFLSILGSCGFLTWGYGIKLFSMWWWLLSLTRALTWWWFRLLVHFEGFWKGY